MCKSETPAAAELNFNDQDELDALCVMRDTMKFAESEELRFKAARYIRDDKRGRLDAVKNMAGQGGFNILVFNQALQAAREKRESVSSKPIDI